MDRDPTPAAERAARRAARGAGAPLLLAVSGGLDSMALLAAMAAAARGRIAAVATFDHGTGPAATAAAAHVARSAAALGLPVVTGRASGVACGSGGDEARWRRERLRFLAGAAAPFGARIATAHTEDDQVETVLMRVLRGAGARGLAGLAAESPFVRPFLGVRRATLEGYLRARGVAWVEDPSNASRRHLRNRVRHDLLPALRRVRPDVDEMLLRTGREAAAWRRRMDALVEPMIVRGGGEPERLEIAASELAGLDRDSLAVVWGALAARAGLALDRRGTHRLASFIIQGPRDGTIPLSGGWSLEARPGAYILGRADGPPAAPAILPASGTVAWGRFRFRVVGGEAGGSETGWRATLPADGAVRVRAWRPGDRLGPAGGAPRRRVTRYLAEAGLRGSERAGWPVVDVEREEDVVWIPGVRRSDAATERSGRPVRHYVCERIAP